MISCPLVKPHTPAMGIQKVRRQTQLITRYVCFATFHILVVSCSFNWNALGPAFLQSSNSAVEELLILLFQPASCRVYNIFVVSKFASFHEFLLLLCIYNVSKSGNLYTMPINVGLVSDKLSILFPKPKQFMKGCKSADDAWQMAGWKCILFFYNQIHEPSSFQL